MPPSEIQQACIYQQRNAIYHLEAGASLVICEAEKGPPSDVSKKPKQNNLASVPKVFPIVSVITYAHDAW